MNMNLTLAFVIALSFTLGGQKAFAQQEWKPFYADLQSVTVAPPPDSKVTSDELREIIALQTNPDKALHEKIHQWHIGPPSYVWELMSYNFFDSTTYWIRTQSYMHVAIYDALVAANSVQATRPAPHEHSPDIRKLGSAGDYAYPCSYSVAAGAAATVLGYLFPEKKDSLMTLAHEVADIRVLAGLQYRSDTREGLKLGIAIAEQVIRRAMADGYEKPYTDTMPTGRIYYSGKPIKREVHKMKTWVLESPSQFRSPPPPDIEQDMQLLRDFKRTDVGTWKAYRWEFSDPWGDIIRQKVLEYRFSSLRAAFAYALVSVANYDFMTAHWDGKYTYFRARPDQYDPTFKAISPTPPSPGYPAGHGTSGYTNAHVLTYLFPYDSALFFNMAKEVNDSRFEAGFHFRSDNEAGMILGEKIGHEVVKWGKQRAESQ